MNVMKNMVFKSKVLISIALTGLLISIVPVSAVVYNVGVKAGDWAKYDVSVTWEGPEEKKGPEFEFYEKLDWFSITVQSVSGKTITAQWIMHLNNGTEFNWTAKGDISIGSGNATGLFSPSGLSEGDEIPGLWEINETISRNYAGVARDVNHLSRHTTGSTFSYDYTEDSDYYFDRATGIICEYSGTSSFDYGTYTITMSFYYNMIETNLWSPPPFWTQWWIWAIVGGIVIIAVAGLILKMRKKPKPIIIAPPETSSKAIWA